MREILGIRKAAKILGISPDTLRSWDISGKYKCDFKTVGGNRRYYEDNLLLQLEKAQGGNKFAE